MQPLSGMFFRIGEPGTHTGAFCNATEDEASCGTHSSTGVCLPQSRAQPEVASIVVKIVIAANRCRDLARSGDRERDLGAIGGVVMRRSWRIALGHVKSAAPWVPRVTLGRPPPQT